MGSSTWAFSRIGLSNTDMRGIASQPDVEAIEAQGCPLDLPESTSIADEHATLLVENSSILRIVPFLNSHCAYLKRACAARSSREHGERVEHDEPLWME